MTVFSWRNPVFIHSINVIVLCLQFMLVPLIFFSFPIGSFGVVFGDIFFRDLLFSFIVMFLLSAVVWLVSDTFLLMHKKTQHVFEVDIFPSVIVLMLDMALLLYYIDLYPLSILLLLASWALSFLIYQRIVEPVFSRAWSDWLCFQFPFRFLFMSLSVIVVFQLFDFLFFIVGFSNTLLLFTASMILLSFLFLRLFFWKHDVFSLFFAAVFYGVSAMVIWQLSMVLFFVTVLCFLLFFGVSVFSQLQQYS